MAKPKRLTPEQVMAAAKYLVATGQLPELMACMTLESTRDVYAEPLEAGQTEEDLTELTKQFAYEEYFDAPDLCNMVEEQIEVFACHYIKK